MLNLTAEHVVSPTIVGFFIQKMQVHVFVIEVDG